MLSPDGVNRPKDAFTINVVGNAKIGTKNVHFLVTTRGWISRIRLAIVATYTAHLRSPNLHHYSCLMPYGSYHVCRENGLTWTVWD